MLAKLEVHIVGGNKYLGGSAEVINANSAGGSSSNLKFSCSLEMPKETARLSGIDIFGENFRSCSGVEAASFVDGLVRNPMTHRPEGPQPASGASKIPYTQIFLLKLLMLQFLDDKLQLEGKYAHSLHASSAVDLWWS